MYYSAIGTLAALILVIENFDILLKRKGSVALPLQRAYRAFLLTVLVYYITDILWGMLESWKLRTALFIDTSVYFLAMAAGVLFWTRCAVLYLGEKGVFGHFLTTAGRVFCGIMAASVAVNIFTPVLFSVDEACVYHTCPIRYMVLGLQIILLLLTAGYSFACMLRKHDSSRSQYLAFTLFSLIKSVFVSIQLWFPYQPLYTIAYMLGTSLLHTFVINDEKYIAQQKLEEALAREKQQYQQLNSAMRMAYTDPLTGVKSKQAYVQAEEELNRQIEEGTAPEFSLAVFDLNGLKLINDTRGHDVGDRYIRDACRLICRTFQHSPVYRVGGDEFTVVLRGEDHQNRAALGERFDRAIDEAEGDPRIIVAMGMADFEPGRDPAVNHVFKRADERMYLRKQELKKRA